MCNSEEQFDYLDPSSGTPEKNMQFRNPTVMRVEEPEIAILAQCRVTYENRIDIMDIMAFFTNLSLHTPTGDFLPTILLSFSAETRSQAEKHASPTHVMGRKRKKG